jgi:ubiquinone/menaquinone biosynthesis C-methylase UbiE
VRGNALKLPFRDKSIDIVMCSQVLHHFREPEAKRADRGNEPRGAFPRS